MRRLQIQNYLLLTLLVLAGAAPSARAEPLEDLQGWEATLPVSASLTREMRKFSTDDGALDATYARKFSGTMHRWILVRTNQIVKRLLAQGCQPSLSVEFPDAGFANGGNADSLTSVEKDFENGIIRIESVACLQHGTPAQALKLFLDPGYRKKAITTVTDYQHVNDQICEQTASVPLLLSETRSWMKISEYLQPASPPASVEGEGISAILGQLSANDAGYQPVYYRETVTVFVRLPGNVLAAYSLMYLRGEKISGVFHSPARGKIESAQKNAFAVLDSELAH